MSSRLPRHRRVPQAVVVLDEVPELLAALAGYHVVLILVHRVVDQLLHLDLESLPTPRPQLGRVTAEPSLTELDLTSNGLSSLDTRIATLSNLTKLSFRQNLFEDATVEPFFAWTALSGLEVRAQSNFVYNLCVLDEFEIE
ncbi:hypothetical protein ACLB2K_018890 [Fragaria x ananassa]